MKSLTAAALASASLLACGQQPPADTPPTPTGLDNSAPDVNQPAEDLTSTTEATTTTEPEPVTTVTSSPPQRPTATITIPETSVARGPLPVDLGSGACGGDLPPCWVLATESGGDPRIWNGGCYNGPCPGGSMASGKWQFLRSTWAGFGGYLDAADAPESVQDQKARLTWSRGLGCAHWNAC